MVSSHQQIDRLTPPMIQAAWWELSTVRAVVVCTMYQVSAYFISSLLNLLLIFHMNHRKSMLNHYKLQHFEPYM